MRQLHQFTPAEWLRLEPVSQGIKQVRNDLLLRHYLRARPPEVADFLRRQAGLRGRDIAIVIAFEQPWALDWLLGMARRNLPQLQVLVFDNSRDAAKRAEIAGVCGRHGAPCLGLPPYRTRHVNRSHGMAMSWIFHNVVQPLQPATFGYLDHDLIPVRPRPPQEVLAGQPVFGMVNAGNHGHWSLWAGYCFYRFDAVSGRPLNFLYDFSRGLDTGGRNWNPVYRGLQRASLRFAPQEFVQLRLPGGGEARKVELVDAGWIHVGGVSYNDNFATKFAFFDALKQALESGHALDDLLVS
jgi:hypothetical protein